MEIILRRYENRYTLMTSNRPIEEWGKLLNDVPAATAILDRFLHHADVIQIKSRSYRLQSAAQAADEEKKVSAPLPNDELNALSFRSEESKKAGLLPTSPKSFSLSLSAILRRSGCAPAEPYPPLIAPRPLRRSSPEGNKT